MHCPTFLAKFAPLLILLGVGLLDAPAGGQPQAGEVQEQPNDPEGTPQGRKQFLGRTVARTMHSSGANWLLRERREQEESATTLRRWLDIQPGQTVCDFGCGNGYHTVPMARAVGEGGKVYAVDLQGEMLRLLSIRLAEFGIKNTIPVKATLDDPNLPEGELDMLLMVDVYHELSHPVRVMTRLRQALKPGGRMVLIEFRGEDSSVPILPLHRMDRAQVVREMAAHNMRFVEAYEELPWQHALVFERAPDPGPRHQAREVALGFLRALARRDSQGIGPFLSSQVTMEGGLEVSRKAFIAGSGLGFGRLGERAVESLELRAGVGGKLLAGPMPRPSAFSLFSVWGDSEIPDLGPMGELVLSAAENGAWSVEGWRPLLPESLQSPRPRLHRPFFAMNTGTGQGKEGKGTPSEQALMVSELGFDGIGWGIWRAGEVRRICEMQGGDLWSVYCVLRLDEGNSPKYQQLLRAMDDLAGGPGMIWLGLQEPAKGLPRGDADQAAKQLLGPLLSHAKLTGVEIALYPHAGFWIATSADALRVCELLDHESLGLCFNLCHFLAAHEESDPTEILQAVLPHLMSVTCNGADRQGEGWGELIQPLGQGDFDLGGLLDSLDHLPWAGPVGLQAWGIKAPPREHLAASHAAWRAAMSR